MSSIKDAAAKAREQWKFMNERDPDLAGKSKEDWRDAREERESRERQDRR